MEGLRSNLLKGAEIDNVHFLLSVAGSEVSRGVFLQHALLPIKFASRLCRTLLTSASLHRSKDKPRERRH